MRYEFLKDLGLEETALTKVESGIDGLIKDQFIPLARFNEVNGKYKEASTKIEELSKMDIDTIKAENTKLKSDLEKKDVDFLNEKKDLLMEQLLTNAKARNNKLAKSLIDVTKVNLKEGKLEGFEEQLKEVKKSSPYLFEDVDPSFGKDPKQARDNALSEADKIFLRNNPGITL
jgi:hypothetical protein